MQTTTEFGYNSKIEGEVIDTGVDDFTFDLRVVTKFSRRLHRVLRFASAVQAKLGVEILRGKRFCDFFHKVADERIETRFESRCDAGSAFVSTESSESAARANPAPLPISRTA